MIISRHAVQRFYERVTILPYDSAIQFIKNDLKKSTLLYTINGIEKRLCDGIVYVVEQGIHPTVITLYLHN